jgi:hypothetical protein
MLWYVIMLAGILFSFLFFITTGDFITYIRYRKCLFSLCPVSRTPPTGQQWSYANALVTNWSGNVLHPDKVQGTCFALSVLAAFLTSVRYHMLAWPLFPPHRSLMSSAEGEEQATQGLITSQSSVASQVPGTGGHGHTGRALFINRVYYMTGT